MCETFKSVDVPVGSALLGERCLPLRPCYPCYHSDGVAVEEVTVREIFESETGENHSGSGETVGSRSQPGRRG